MKNILEDICCVIMDFDDVIINTFRNTERLVMDISGVFGIAMAKREDVIACWGGPVDIFVDSLVKRLNWSPDQRHLFHKEFMAAEIKYDLCLGVRKFISYCRDHKIFLGILTNREYASVIDILKAKRISLKYFFHISSPNSKPGPKLDRFNEEFDPRITSMNIDFSQVLYIGDSLTHDWPVARDHKPPLKFIGKVTDMYGAEHFTAKELSYIKSFNQFLS